MKARHILYAGCRRVEITCFSREEHTHKHTPHNPLSVLPSQLPCHKHNKARGSSVRSSRLSTKKNIRPSGMDGGTAVLRISINNSGTVLGMAVKTCVCILFLPTENI